MRKDKAPEKTKKRRLIRVVIVELIIMVVSVCVSIMPMPYRLIVPIIIGARSILLKAHQSVKTPPAPEVVHCCGKSEEKPKSKKKQIKNSKKQ